MASEPAVLFGSIGLRIDGGIACVARTIARAFDEEVEAGRLDRADRVMLLEEPEDAYPAPARGELSFARGSQLRMVGQLWWSHLRHRHDLVLFDHLGLARSTLLPLPGFSPRYAIFCHLTELLLVGENDGRRRVLRGAWRLLANSEMTGEIIRSRFPEVADRVRVTPLCIDPERVAGWPPLEEPPCSPREPAALVVGRMWEDEPGKGHDALIEAWPSVLHRVPAAQLWIVGSGSDQQRLEDLARKRAPAESVQFRGRVSDRELSDLYCRASVFAMPSRQEGFGLVYPEAMWHGLPCIGSTADAGREVIDAGETGLLVPYGDVEATANALVALLADPVRRAKMGEAAFVRVRERYLYPRFRRDLLEALELPPE